MPYKFQIISVCPESVVPFYVTDTVVSDYITVNYKNTGKLLSSVVTYPVGGLIEVRDVEFATEGDWLEFFADSTVSIMRDARRLYNLENGITLTRVVG